MNKLSIRSVIWLLALLAFHFVGFSQTEKKIDETKSQQKKLEDQIKYQNMLLQETKKNRQMSMGQLVFINKNIEKRQELIKTIHAQIRMLNDQISDNQSLVEAMENDLEKLKSEYADMVVQAYKNKSDYNKWMFILSSSDFNQAYKRMKYYQQYSEYRKTQAEAIKKTRELLDSEIRNLEARKTTKRKLLGYEESEKHKLSQEKDQKQNAIVELQLKEKSLKKELKEKQKQAEKLQKVILDMIRDLEEKRKKGSFVLTPESMDLMNKFVENKGKLPWPVEKGVITGLFGKQPHEALKDIWINNDGVVISSERGTKARAVFEGTVSKVIIIPNSGKAILIRHGEYLTVYNKLKESYVQPGDKVSTKQEIGTVLTDESTGETELEFQIWYGAKKDNPSFWLFKAK